MNRWIKMFLVVISIGGCATTTPPKFAVTVDSLAGPAAQEHRTYILLPGNEGATWDDLQFQEYASYVMRVLDAQKFVLAKSPEDADVAIVLSYGIGDPETRQYTYSLPVWGKTGVSSSQTYGTATSYGNTATYSGTTTYTPSYGITGYSSQTASVTTYFRYASITGYDFRQFKESNRQVQLWRTNISSTGSSGDLRQVFPVLVAASVPYLATNTGKQVPVELLEDDDVVRAVKGEVIDKTND